LHRRIVLAVVLILLFTRGIECAEAEFSLFESDDVKRSSENVISKSERFPVIPDFIKKISYDVKKTDSEIALLDQIDSLFIEVSGNLSDPKLTLLKESQSSWVNYYEKETYGLYPANGFVALTSGDKKKINAYRENLKVILEGRKSIIENLLNNKHDYLDNGEFSKIEARIKYCQGKVEYFSEERHRPRVVAGEEAWKLYLNANEQFLKSYFADDPEKIEMYKMYAQKERLRILELQLAALERLRIEREE
jgi:hypothetical protein